MKANPHREYGIVEIGKRFGIPKHFIDREGALSSGCPRIRRIRSGGGVRWVYVPKGG